MTESQELSRLCKAVGDDVMMVQGGGGNGSVKSADGRAMWVKASGFRMSEVEPERGFARIQTDAMTAIVRDPDLAAMSAVDAHIECVRRTNALAPDGSRPSMETGFHALLGRVVLHTHCVPINAFACSPDGERLLKESVDEPFVWIPYVTPGYVLSGEIDRRLAKGPIRAIVLANHGFIASADTLEEVLDVTERFVSAAVATFGPIPNSRAENPDSEVDAWTEGLRSALEARGSKLSVASSTAEIVRRSSIRPSGMAGSLIPDDAIYSGLNLETFTIEELPAAWLDRTAFAGKDRFVAVCAGRGALFAGPAKSVEAMRESVVASAVLRELVRRQGEPTFIPEPECRYLLSMESEKYRQAVSAGAQGV